jgi:hypothetical protein
VLDPQYLEQTIGGGGIVIVINGRIAGTWKRILEKDRVVIRLHPFTPLAAEENLAIIQAAERFGKFLEMPVDLA